MYAKVIGTEVKSGSFTDPETNRNIVYNNIYLHCVKNNTYDSEGSFGYGSCPISVKIKNSIEKVSAVFGSSVTRNDLESMVGTDVIIYYDERGQIDTIMPAPANKKPEK